MSSLAALETLPDVSHYNDWNSVKQALQNWSVRDKFTFRTPCKDDRRARYVCTQQGCRFRVTGNKDRSGRITVKVVNRDHTCANQDLGNNALAPAEALDDTQENHAPARDNDNENQGAGDQKDLKYRNPATQMKWLVTAIERVLDVTTETKPHDIQAAAKEYYNEQISYQQAFRCLRLLTAEIKEQGHRERVPDELRKAIVTLRVFVDPPMDWIEIERKTGIKARTAGYIFTSAEKKSGGSKDPFVLLKNATISTSGPKAGDKGSKASIAGKTPGSTSQNGLYSPTTDLVSRNSRAEFPEPQSQPRKRRKVDDMIDPNLDVTVELARAAAEIENNDDLQEGQQGDVLSEEDYMVDNGPVITGEARLPATTSLQRRMAKQPTRSFSANGSGVEERVLNALGGHR